MIITKYGDLLEAKGVIVHGCNAHGVMGSGVAKQIKAKWPEAYRLYYTRTYMVSKVMLMGRIPSVLDKEGNLIVNMITQMHYGRDPNIVYVDYEAVRKGFHRLNFELLEYIRDGHWYANTVNFPLIGCGLANGSWRIISKIIDSELDDSLTKVLWLQNK